MGCSFVSQRSWLIISRHLLLAPLLVLAACGSTNWRDTAPDVLRGTWLQVSDDVSAGLDRADTLVIEAAQVYLASYRLDADPWRLQCPVRHVSESAGSYVIFCGAADAKHVAEHRFELDPESSGHFLLVGELIATGINDDDGYESIGRFVYAR